MNVQSKKAFEYFAPVAALRPHMARSSRLRPAHNILHHQLIKIHRQVELALGPEGCARLFPQPDHAYDVRKTYSQFQSAAGDRKTPEILRFNHFLSRRE
jgi:hypothetical protein